MSKKSIYFCGDLFVDDDAPQDWHVGLFEFAGGSPVLVNLEGAAATEADRVDPLKACPLALRSGIVAETPDNVLFSLANNHSTDFGKKAYERTRAQLGVRHAPSAGSHGENILGVNVIFMTDGREGCKSDEIGCLNFDNIGVQRASTVSRPVVYIHGGLEYRFYPTVMQRNLAQRLVRNGARGVLFHHSHQAGAVEIYNGVPIFYGLGNFLFSQVQGLHGFEENNGLIVQYDASDEFWSVADIRGNRNLMTVSGSDFEPVVRSDMDALPKDYRSFYKAKYPLDSSFRPRQLEENEWFLNTKYHAWQSITSVLLRFGWTKKLKTLIQPLFRKSNA